MVVPMSWLSEIRARVGANKHDNSVHLPKHEVLGILAFEAAATMSHLVSLHKGLSDAEIVNLRSDTMRSQGVAYLNSTDQAFLLRLACAESIDDLDCAADAISRLERKCRMPHTKGFSRFYADLKAGNGPCIVKKGVEKKVRKMEKYIAATSNLCGEMGDMDAARQKLNKQWKRNSSLMPIQKADSNNSEILRELKSQQQRIHRLKDESLWNQTFDKAVELMAAATLLIFARICTVFGPFVPGLPPMVTVNDKSSSVWFAPVSKLRIYPRFSSSGPMNKPLPKEIEIRNSCPIFGSKEDVHNNDNWRKILEPPPNTVGGSSMSLRYAEVIVAAENLWTMLSSDDESLIEKKHSWEAVARDELYLMLPIGLQRAVRRKMKECWRDAGPNLIDGCLAESWKEAVERILSWLRPMALDTLNWRASRNMDRRQWFEIKPKVFLLQTLHLSDMEKTEAAIVEVLVGLSCVYWYQERRNGSFRMQLF